MMDESLFGAIIMAAVCVMNALIFFGLALYAAKRADPMHFWSGSTVRPQEIRDIPAYNRANAVMWAVYGFIWLPIVLTGFFHMTLAGILVAAAAVGGLPVLISTYQKIYQKYKN